MSPMNRHLPSRGRPLCLSLLGRGLELAKVYYIILNILFRKQKNAKKLDRLEK